MVEEAVAMVEVAGMVEASAAGMVEASAAGMVEASAAGMVEASAAGMASVVAVIFALGGGMAICREAKKTGIGSAIMGAAWAGSFGIYQFGVCGPWETSIFPNPGEP